jgi:methionine-rich copper-binding protein CopC
MIGKNSKRFLMLAAPFAIALTIINQPIARAHAELLESKALYQKDNSIEFILRFNENVEVEDLLLVNSNFKKQRISFRVNADTVNIKSNKLPKDRYILRYKIISQDGHRIIGSIGVPNQVKDKQAKPQYLKALTLDNKKSLELSISASHPGNIKIISGNLTSIRAVKITHIKSKITLQTSKKEGYFESYLPLTGAWSMEISYKEDKFTEEQYYVKFEIKP